MPFIKLTNQDDTALFPTFSPLEPFELFGRGGNDNLTVAGLHGLFYISGGAGNDTIKTGLTGSDASYDVDGGSGDDVITGVGGTNYFAGDSGNDTLSGSFGTFTLDGGAGNDILTLGRSSLGLLEGGSGNDTLTGNAQFSQFVMYGGSGDDLLQGIGNQSVFHEEYNGDSGNDTLISLGGDDLLDGGSGNDILRGGDGSDTLWGGSGKDTFQFTNRSDPGNVAYRDVIEDFDRGDKIQFIGTGLAFSNLAISNGAEGAEIRYTDNLGFIDTIVLADVRAADLRPGDFIFG